MELGADAHKYNTAKNKREEAAAYRHATAGGRLESGKEQLKVRRR